MINFLITKNDFNIMWSDIVKFLTVIIIFHILSYIVDDQDNFFSENFIKSLLYIVVGILTYYFITKQLTNKFILKNNENILENQLTEHNIENKENYKKIDKKNKNKKYNDKKKCYKKN